MTTNGNSANYAPLKQILSESESEDDNKLENAVQAGDGRNMDFNTGLLVSRNSMSDMDDFNSNLNTMESTMDNVSFLQSDMSSKLSTPRRFAFITSILLCIIVIIVFLWGIPCSDFGSCPGAEWQDKTTSWEFPYDEVELSGAVQVVDGAIPFTKNLIFIYRGNHMRKDSLNDDNVNGVLLIVGNTGKVGWYTRESRIPTEINCHLIDVNNDKIKDCIVSGSEGLLAAISPLAGTYYWYMHKQGKVLSNIAAIDFPIVMKDMDKDNVSDLLTVATVYPNTNHNSLLVISGATGNIIGEPLVMNDCLTVKLISVSETISYICKNGATEAVRDKEYSVLYKKLVTVEHANHTKHAKPINKKVNINFKKSIGNTRVLYSNGPGKLIVENSGECPDSCKVNLTLLLDRNGSSTVSWEYTANYVFAMKPSTFAFANSIRGFVLKL
ncbi:uncharacterized protein LOC114253331 isoform X3 [Bombyx mandarina]|uniref:Uncharacterized protein LOC114253331 isoform X1 n=1 Tax=Bombyx mandarina TaxID=7092 RepID=A0A6J2KNR8_BOMMA|nr:uncharacterized protein LOC114253331 isoform X1 [Bombyx mandarina]XP_028043971.1 uncharacterized protein LOC114253331 isoform X2 [Bombyx mandarina]XP_028043972.1 uncharacterized protein LOC114253331 isoform X3 [Bombyx mandarina]